MDLTQVSAQIRPRNHYEAIDLGFIMARHWALPLWGLWLCISFPIFILLQIIFHQSPYISATVIWWLKPLLDTIQLHYVSEKLFSKQVTFKSILKQSPKRLWQSALVKLTLRRPSLSRSFDIPVSDLEKLTGNQRSKRLTVLHRSANSAAIGLTVVGIAIENIIVLALFGLVWMLIPPQLDIHIEFWDLITHVEVHRLLSWSWYIAMALVAPFYVTAGFSLYINRRTTLEGWDIELSFKDMASRVTKPILMILLVGSLTGLTMMTPTNSVADQANSAQANISTDRPLGELVSDLSPHRAQQHIILILESDVFNDIRKQESWKLKNPKQIDKEEEESLPPWLAELLPMFAQGAEILLWGFAAFCLIFILLRLKGIEVPFLEAKKYVRRPPPTSLFGLEINQDSLPEDVIATAKECWRRNPRQAYSLLYRAALSDLVHAETLPLQSSHTEGECVRLFSRKSRGNPKSKFFKTLTEQWVMLAYGHKRVSHKQFDVLCDEWTSHFPNNSEVEQGETTQ